MSRHGMCRYLQGRCRLQEWQKSLQIFYTVSDDVWFGDIFCYRYIVGSLVAGSQVGVTEVHKYEIRGQHLTRQW